MTEAPPPWTDGVDEPSGPGRWRLSTPVVLVAVLYLLLAALAAFLTAVDAANGLAVFAVQVLGVGVALRLVEYATGDRLWVALAETVRVGWTSLGRVGSWARRRDVTRRPDGGDRRTYLSVEDVRESLRLAALLTFVGGLLLVVLWWDDPTRVVSGPYLGGWVLGLGLLVAVYVALSEGR